jgi:uncharacterized repeat protein (TIGR03803 family)
MRRSFAPLAALLAAGPAAAQPYSFSTVFTFAGANANPNGGLVVDGFGNLYGTTSGSCDCGAPPPRTGLTNPPLTPPPRPGQPPTPAGYGTVFRLAPAGAGQPYALTALHTFAGADGASPYAGLIRDGATLYGTTSYGGTDLAGTVFKVETGGTGFQTLHNFTGLGTQGFFPVAPLARVGATLYGTTAYGGANDLGSVFRVGTGGTGFQTLGSFDGTNGAIPSAGLTADAAGVLYGATGYGGSGASPDGTLFRLDPNGPTPAITPLVNFSGTSPNGGLVLSSGKLLGADCNCGPGGDSVFRVNLNGTDFSPVATFGGSNGDDPTGPLVADAAGNLYGVTQQGGANGLGTVFKLAFDGTNYTLSTLYTFTGGADGGTPLGGLTLGADGTLYGVTADGAGTVFALVPVPEPAALGVAAAGLAAAGWARRRRATAYTNSFASRKR